MQRAASSPQPSRAMAAKPSFAALVFVVLHFLYHNCPIMSWLSHIILDNAAAHKSRKLVEYLKDSRIRLHYLPPYSPNLNPIERLWKVFRETTLYNRYFETCAEFFTVVRDFFTAKVHKIKPLLAQRINDNFQTIKLNPIIIG